MTMKFECTKCCVVFEDEGTKKEWKDPVYGFCWKTIAYCPSCNAECSEYRHKRSKKNCSSGSCSNCNCGGSCGC